MKLRNMYLIIKGSSKVFFPLIVGKLMFWQKKLCKLASTKYFQSLKLLYTPMEIGSEINKNMNLMRVPDADNIPLLFSCHTNLPT